jgi:hypothetical protein
MSNEDLEIATERAGDVRLRVLDLFCGLGGWSRPLRDRGHDVTTLDYLPRFAADHVRDIREVVSLDELEQGRGRFDVVVASPPCETFSVAAMWRHWTRRGNSYSIKTAAAQRGLAIMDRTFALIERYRPDFYVIENPRGMMRKVAPRLPNHTVWYCKLGDQRAKPTDLWTNLRVRFPSICRNSNPACDHLRAARGTHAGTQGLPKDARALIPYGLGLTVALAAEFLTAARSSR